jgi:hypothetical protein
MWANQDTTVTDPPETELADPHTYDLDRIMERISLSGYYRFYGLLRTLENSFPVIPSNEFASTPPFIIGAGDSYRDPPLILMSILGSPGGGANIGMDLAMYHNFTSNVGQGGINLNLGTSLYGSISTGLGRFGMQVGGINWTELSDFTFGSFVGYERSSTFERNPWEGIAGASNRAEFFFDKGTIQRDARWAKQAFKGIIFDGYELPGRFSFRAMYGKTPATASLGSQVPRFSTGGQIKKMLGKDGYLAINSMNYVSNLDSISDIRSGLQIHTLSGSGNIGELLIRGEAGMGTTFMTDVDKDWGEAIKLSFKSSSKLTRFPIELEFYRISPKFVNYYASFLSFNTQVPGVDGQIQGISSGGTSSFAGSITSVGQLTNNRQGVNLNAWFDFGSLKANIGLGVGQEIEKLTDKLSFGHMINGYPLSRLVLFSSGVGPYQRWNSFFRGVSEELFITDLDEDGLPKSLTTFNMLQVHLKQRVTAGKIPVYAFYVGSFGSAGDSFKPIPEFSDAAYLRTHAHQFDVTIGVTPLFDVVLSYGLERIMANNRTNTIYYIDEDGALAGANLEYVEGQVFSDYPIAGTQIPGANYSGAAFPSTSPIDQTSTHIGFGLDINSGEKTGVYIRHRRFTQVDDGFGGDNITGHDTSVELKIYF